MVKMIDEIVILREIPGSYFLYDVLESKDFFKGIETPVKTNVNNFEIINRTLGSSTIIKFGKKVPIDELGLKNYIDTEKNIIGFFKTLFITITANGSVFYNIYCIKETIIGPAKIRLNVINPVIKEVDGKTCLIF